MGISAAEKPLSKSSLTGAANLPPENLCLGIATVNGTGSMSANQMLSRMLFRAGWRPGYYNFFPSNIAGLPCLYSIRLNSKGWTAYEPDCDILLSLNPKTLSKNLESLKPGGILITDEKDNAEASLKARRWGPTAKPFRHIPLPLTKSLPGLKNVSLKMRPLLRNILYAGLFAEWLQVERETAQKTMSDFFSGAGEQNLQAFEMGRGMGRQNPMGFPPPGKPPAPAESQILIDGNTGVALGALFSGCQLLSWYPITPATSIAESFEKYAGACQKGPGGKKKYAVIQAEDEIAALGQAIGAGWAGIRAMTATSGPGLSLMSEGAGLAYFSETPVVLCNVQRAGPSTGLPTRTHQGDLLPSCFLSHGGCSHVVLLPGTPEECFSLAQKAFDLAEELQTLVIILSDLDLGMNLRPSPVFRAGGRRLRRGKILQAQDLSQPEFADFGRYRDPDGDGISRRALPGTRHEKAGYLVRGSGHNERAEYSEEPEDYSGKLNKLKRKLAAARRMMPEPVMETSKSASIAFAAFGSSHEAARELAASLKRERGISSGFMRLRSFPFPESAGDFLRAHSEIFVVEQNRDGQLRRLLSGEFPSEAHKLKSILQYDGRPLFVRHIKRAFFEAAGLGAAG